MILSCLGRANYWVTVPFLLFVAALALVMVLRPARVRFNATSLVEIRMIGAAALLMAFWMLPQALREARERPNCEPTFESIQVSPDSVGA